MKKLRSRKRVAAVRGCARPVIGTRQTQRSPAHNRRNGLKKRANYRQPATGTTMGQSTSKPHPTQVRERSVNHLRQVKDRYTPQTLTSDQSDPCTHRCCGSPQKGEHPKCCRSWLACDLLIFNVNKLRSNTLFSAAWRGRIQRCVRVFRQQSPPLQRAHQ